MSTNIGTTATYAIHRRPVRKQRRVINERLEQKVRTLIMQSRHTVPPGPTGPPDKDPAPGGRIHNAEPDEPTPTPDDAEQADEAEPADASERSDEEAEESEQSAEETAQQYA